MMGGSSSHEFSWLCVEQFIIMIMIIEECLEDKEIYRQILITFFLSLSLLLFIKKNLFMCVLKHYSFMLYNDQYLNGNVNKYPKNT